MDGIVDYIRWLGRFSFRELPFCDTDALVMCVISYFDLDPALEEGAVRVSECGKALENGSVTLQITGGDMGNSEIFREAIASKRFGELTISDYEDVLQPKMPLQYASVTLSYQDEFSFLAYRGTDETIAGWKEDFMISFTQTESQRLAAEYARRVIRPGRRYYLGGHSKGANHALYAACSLDEGLWSQVERVYLLDGPGLCPEVMDVSNLARVNGKTTRIVPEFDVVGRLFQPKIDDTRIIRSSASGILQHSLATWGVSYGELALAPAQDRRSVALTQALNQWVEAMSQEDRRAMTEELFGALAAGGAVTLSEVADSGAQSFEAVFLRIFRDSPVTKKIMKELPSQVLDFLRRQIHPGEETRERE